MKHVKQIFQLLLPLLLLGAAGAALVFWMVGREEKSQREMLSAAGFLGNTTGFWVTTGLDTWRDFPHEDGLSREELEARLDGMVELAETARLNAIFFQARADGAAFYQSKYFDPHPSLSGAKGTLGAFDPLDYLCSAGLERGIRVYAILDADPAPSGSAEDLAVSTGELAKNYPVGGILLTGLDRTGGEEIAEILRAVRARLDRDAPGTPMGLLFSADSETITPDLISGLTGDRTIEIAAPRLNQDVTGGAFFAALRRWTGAAAPSAKVLPSLRLYYEGPAEEQQEMELRLLAATMEEAASGVVLEYYSQLAQDSRWARRAAGLLNAPRGPAPALDFAVPGELAITYPAGDVSVTDSAIFLMGTSDPGLPLVLDGEELDRTTAGGTWGALKKLEMGENTFTLRQGELTRQVTVRRYTPGVTTIDSITEGSIFPRYSCGVDSDAKLVLSCMAPAGGSVTATLNGRTISLAQDGTAAQNGVPVAFRGTMELNPADYDPNTTAGIGPVTYQLTYGGVTSSYQSQGEVYVAGRNAPLVVENTAQLSAVLTDPDDDETITGSLKPGARAYVEETVRTSRGGAVTLAYKLRGSGYILAGTPGSGPMAEVVTGAPQVSMEIGEITTSLGEDGSLTVTLGEGTPAVVASRDGEQLVLDCFATTVSGEPAQLTNGFIRSASAREITGGTRITLALEPEGGLWGYDLFYRDGKTCLYLKPAPKPGGSYACPLEGVTVLLDPGHGGSDPGAMGVAGQSGPAEAQLNLAVSQAVKYRLEQLGASVSLTRTDDSKVSLNQRVDAATAMRPDIFLSIHHNSGVLTGNMNQARRMECYYFEDISAPFARALMDALPGAVGRPGTEPEQARYYVTRQTGNPAVLLEVGFMVNPLEYEECLDRATILKTACGVADAVCRTVGG